MKPAVLRRLHKYTELVVLPTLSQQFIYAADTIISAEYTLRATAKRRTNVVAATTGSK